MSKSQGKSHRNNDAVDLKASKRRERFNFGSVDRLLPHSHEAEQGVLGCILLSPKECLAHCIEKRDLRLKTVGLFYDLRHETIYDALMELFHKENLIDVITLQQHLKDKKLLQEVGGIAYLQSLPEVVPSAANLSYYFSMLQEKALLRQLIRVGTDIVARVYDCEGNVDELCDEVERDFGQCLYKHESASSRVLGIRELVDYNVDNDPNAIIGVHDGKTTRYLCRGYGAWLIGPSGVGKSSLVIQQAILWALGRAFLGIEPIKALRVLIVQAENDDGDMAEMVQGTTRALLADDFNYDAELDTLDGNLKFVTERSLIGEPFCKWLGRQIEKHRADVVFGDPFLSFAGIDVSRQDQCSRFLRNWLNPILSATGAVMIGAHHTGKPKRKQDQRGWTAHDYAYEGLGSSELVNWARAISVVVPHGDHYELKLAKRGIRAAATHPDGVTPTMSLWLRHAQGRIFWEQIEPPQEPEVEQLKKKPKEVRVSTPMRIAALNLHSFLQSIPPEGEGFRAIRGRLKNWLTSDEAPERIAAGDTTVGTAVYKLVENQKLVAHDDTYRKGPNA